MHKTTKNPFQEQPIPDLADEVKKLVRLVKKGVNERTKARAMELRFALNQCHERLFGVHPHEEQDNLFRPSVDEEAERVRGILLKLRELLCVVIGWKLEWDISHNGPTHGQIAARLAEIADNLGSSEANEPEGESSVSDQANEPPPDGNWSANMSKAELMLRLQLKRVAFGTFIKTKRMRRISRQQWSICLDDLNERERHMIEEGRPPKR